MQCCGALVVKLFKHALARWLKHSGASRSRSLQERNLHERLRVQRLQFRLQYKDTMPILRCVIACSSAGINLLEHDACGKWYLHKIQKMAIVICMQMIGGCWQDVHGGKACDEFCTILSCRKPNRSRSSHDGEARAV